MDDEAPTVQPDLVPVARFSGSRLASAPTPSPFQSNDGRSAPHQKVRRLSPGSSVGAAIVDVENSLESDERENKEELKTKLKELIREKSDAFNSDTTEEDKVLFSEFTLLGISLVFSYGQSLGLPSFLKVVSICIGEARATWMERTLL
jgi:5'-3' exoribonuclease 2